MKRKCLFAFFLILPIVVNAAPTSQAYEWLENSLSELDLSQASSNSEKMELMPSICRAKLNLASYPGQLADAGCKVVVRGHVFFVPDYETLMAFHDTKWVHKGGLSGYLYQQSWPTNAGIGPAVLPENQWPIGYEPVVGGQTDEGNIYICRVKMNNQNYIGHVQEDACEIAIGNEDSREPDYDVLFVKT